MKQLKNTVERINPAYFRTREKYLLYLRHVFAYEYALQHIHKNAHVLEVGFGEGYGTAMIATRASRTTAIDVSEENVAYASQKYASETCSFQWYDGHRFPFEDHRFDVVIAFQVIEHIEKDQYFLAEAYRVLNKGGLLMLTTPNRIYRVPPGKSVWNKYHVREYDPADFERMLRSVFEQVRVLGIRGDEEAQQIEIVRVKRRPSLRKMIPEGIRKYFHGDVMTRYSIEKFFIIQDQVEESLDLVGICRKFWLPGTPACLRNL